MIQALRLIPSILIASVKSNFNPHGKHPPLPLPFSLMKLARLRLLYIKPQ